MALRICNGCKKRVSQKEIENNKCKICNQLDEDILLKVDNNFQISGGGRIMLALVYWSGGWRKYIKEVKIRAKRNKNLESELDYIKKFKKQEKKYGIKVKILNPKDNIDNMEYGYTLKKGK